MKQTNKSRYAVLGVLSLQDASGYDIKKMLEQSTYHFWREGDGTLYPVLAQLLREGLICSLEQNTPTKKPKKIYQLTDKGKESLQAWLKNEEMMRLVRNELLLKIFFGHQVDSAIILNQLDNFKHETQKRLNKFNSLLAHYTENKLTGEKLYRYLTLQSGILHCETDLKWCEQSRNLLNNA